MDQEQYRKEIEPLVMQLVDACSSAGISATVGIQLPDRGVLLSGTQIEKDRGLSHLLARLALMSNDSIDEFMMGMRSLYSAAPVYFANSKFGELLKAAMEKNDE